MNDTTKAPQTQVFGTQGKVVGFMSSRAVGINPVQEQGQTRFRHQSNQNETQEDYDIEAIPWPSPLGQSAFYGFAGAVVRDISPYTEADTAALLLNFLTAAGNMVGSGPHFMAGEDKHQLKINVALVGETAKGRKGSSWSPIAALFRLVDEEWTKWRVLPGGMSTAEGLIWQVRDPITQRQPVKEKGHVVNYEDVEIDPGITDKRLLIVEAEFAAALKVAARQGNTLSPLIRRAWDSDTLGSLTKSSLARSTGAHISIIGHITRHELLTCFTESDQVNGYANRFLWACVRRSKCLPDGSRIPEHILNGLAVRLRTVLDASPTIGEIRRSPEAADIWRTIYPTLSAGRPGLAGAVVARAEAQVSRLACIYAILDRSPVVNLDHLNAAVAVWHYCEASARFIFGIAQRDPIADRVLDALEAGPMTQTELNDGFSGHLSSKAIREALQRLSAVGKVVYREESTKGRPKITWRLAEKAEKAEKGMALRLRGAEKDAEKDAEKVSSTGGDPLFRS